MHYIKLILNNDFLFFFTGDTYADCINRIQAPASCSDYANVATSYRRHDGLCNNLEFTTIGAIRTPLRRLISKFYYLIEQRNVVFIFLVH